MKVYEQEKNDGLEELVLASRLQTFSAPIILSEKKGKELENLPILASVRDRSDLFVYDSILCTVGEPNLNGIYFLPEEAFGSKDSPIDKQVNMNHTDDVVGHMIKSYIVNDDYEPIEAEANSLPDYFHILVESVIYLSWKEQEREEKIAELVSEIKNGEWDVSLECLCPDFDYLFLNEDKTYSLLARTEDTAYLTKYLKNFNGTGEFNGKAIYCAPKGMWFSGKGLTRNPANPKSKIVAEKNENVYLTLDENINSLKNNLGENIMTEDERKQLVKDIKDALTLTASASTSELKEGFDFAAALEALSATVNALTEKLETSLAQYTAKVTELETVVAAKDAEIKTLTENVTTVTASLASEKNDKITILRSAKLIKAGFDQESAEAFVANTIGLTDEQFEAVLAKVSLTPVTASKVEPEDDVKTIENAVPDPAPVTVVAEQKTSLADDFKGFWASADKSKK